MEPKLGPVDAWRQRAASDASWDDEVAASSAEGVVEGREGERAMLPPAMASVVIAGRALCGQVYRCPGFDYVLVGTLARRLGVSLHPSIPEAHAFAALVDWRDRTARTADVSPGRVLAGHALVTVAKQLPTRQSDLLRYSRPTGAFVAAEQDTLLDML